MTSRDPDGNEIITKTYGDIYRKVIYGPKQKGAEDALGNLIVYNVVGSNYVIKLIAVSWDTAKVRYTKTIATDFLDASIRWIGWDVSKRCFSVVGWKASDRTFRRRLVKDGESEEILHTVPDLGQGATGNSIALGRYAADGTYTLGLYYALQFIISIIPFVAWTDHYYQDIPGSGGLIKGVAREQFTASAFEFYEGETLVRVAGTYEFQSSPPYTAQSWLYYSTGEAVQLTNLTSGVVYSGVLGSTTVGDKILVNYEQVGGANAARSSLTLPRSPNGPQVLGDDDAAKPYRLPVYIADKKVVYCVGDNTHRVYSHKMAPLFTMPALCRGTGYYAPVNF